MCQTTHENIFHQVPQQRHYDSNKPCRTINKSPLKSANTQRVTRYLRQFPWWSNLRYNVFLSTPAHKPDIWAQNLAGEQRFKALVNLIRKINPRARRLRHRTNQRRITNVPIAEQMAPI